MNKATKEEQVKILGVEYLRKHFSCGDELYMTRAGKPFLENVFSGQWHGSDDFRCRKEQLRGTGTLFRLYAKEAELCPFDLVVKWSRVGQNVPGQNPDVADEKYGHAEFNSPFEEFALLTELRNMRPPDSKPILTHRPLGIYVPAQRVEPDRQGRKNYLFNKKSSLEGVELDLYRQYLLVYEWIKGLDLVQASEVIDLSEKDMEELTIKAESQLERRGFRDCDRKPHHIIVRVGDEGRLKKDRDFETMYAHVDFEMLERTPEREKSAKAARRSQYLIRQRDRFDPVPRDKYPPQLYHVNIFGVDYVYGEVGSTGGSLWVVGKDPVLFDYFLPERWRRTPRKKLSHSHQVYYTLTKDSIHLVWRVSRVGEKPDYYDAANLAKEMIVHGYNSPFEEFSLALELENKGVRVIYPRAIYKTGTTNMASESLADRRRYRTHRKIVMPNGDPALQPDRDYIAIWGYWNGPDELLAARDGDYYHGENLLHAFRDEVVTKEELETLMETEEDRFRTAGIVGYYLHPEHFMITHDVNGNIIRDRDGLPELRLCNLELLWRKV